MEMRLNCNLRIRSDNLIVNIAVEECDDDLNDDDHGERDDVPSDHLNQYFLAKWIAALNVLQSTRSRQEKKLVLFK